MNKEEIRKEIKKRIDEYVELKKQYEEYRKNNPILNERSKFTMLDYIEKQNNFIVQLLSFFIMEKL